MTDNIEREKLAYEGFKAWVRHPDDSTVQKSWDDCDPHSKECWCLVGDAIRAALSQPPASGAVDDGWQSPFSALDAIEYCAGNDIKAHGMKVIHELCQVARSGFRHELSRATATPDESRELALIEFVKSYMDAVCDDYENDNAGALAAFNKSRKR